jgi:L-alanine-DL-glutamate epimerase-like enolase superfamily enzyme
MTAGTGSPVVAVDAIVLRAPTLGPDDLDGSSETVVVTVTDADGRTGIGEADAPADVVRTLVVMDDVHAWSRGLASALVGRDPFELAACNAALYDATIYHGRRGLGIHALSAVDIALHDLVGKQLGRPVYQLLGGARRDAVRPYATIYAGFAAERPVRDELDDLLERCTRALELGFSAVKVEALFGSRASDRTLIECIRECRSTIGPDVALMLDLGYRWRDWREALWTLRRVEECDLYFVEAAQRPSALWRLPLAGGPALTFSLGGLSKSIGLPQAKLSWIAAAGALCTFGSRSRCAVWWPRHAAVRAANC